MRYEPSSHAGFTLVELSIVLVIIGLIVGGITMGQALVESARLSSFVSETEKLNSAANAFKQRFGQLPGDLDNAFSFFGTDCASTAGSCNGDGDGGLESSNYASYTGNGSERCKFFKHMQLAGMWEDFYECAHGGPAVGSAPRTPFNDLSYYIVSTKCPPGSGSPNCIASTAFLTGAGHYIFTGGVYNNSITSQYFYCGTGPQNEEAFSAGHMLQLDNKLDDGLPMSGQMVAPSNSNALCLGEVGTTSHPCITANGEYDISSDEVRCNMRLRMSF